MRRGDRAGPGHGEGQCARVRVRDGRIRPRDERAARPAEREQAVEDQLAGRHRQADPPQRRRAPGQADAEDPGEGEREHNAQGAWAGSPAEGYRAEPVGAPAALLLSALARSNALAVVPEAVTDVRAGDRLHCLLLDP